MPLISGNYDPAVGVLLQLAVLPPAQVVALQASQPPTGQAPNLSMFMALVDTGASVTCISNKVVQSLRLPPSGKTTMSGSTGRGTVDQYTFGVAFLIGAQQGPSGIISGSLNIHLVQGCEFTNHGFGFDILLGRDIICKGGLVMTFDGHFSFAL